jgi:hypothetical protein
VYVGAQRAPFREAGRPGIEISGDGRGCNTISGSFEVRELVVAADGSVQRAWIMYEQHCEGGTAALFGRSGSASPRAASRRCCDGPRAMSAAAVKPCR